MHGWSDLNRCKLLEANDENGKGYHPSSPSSHLLPSQGSVIQVMELQVVRQLLGPELSGSCQAVVRKLSGSCQAIIRKGSGSCHIVVINQTLFLPFIVKSMYWTERLFSLV